MSHFIPRTQGIKAHISKSVCWRRVSAGKRTTGRFHLLALMPPKEADGVGSRTIATPREGRAATEEGRGGWGTAKEKEMCTCAREQSGVLLCYG